MTLEVTRGQSKWMHRTCPDNPSLIERRENKRGSRWKPFRICESEAVARAAILKLNDRQEGQSEENGV